MSKGVEVVDGVGVLRKGDALIVLWTKPASAERWAFQLSAMQAMAPSHDDGILVLVLILAVDTPPEASVRTDMEAALRRMGPQLRRLVAVPLGDSVWLSIIRTIVRGLIIVSGQSHRHRVADRVSDGIDLLQEKAGPLTPTKSELLQGIAELSLALGLPASVAA